MKKQGRRVNANFALWCLVFKQGCTQSCLSVLCRKSPVFFPQQSSRACGTRSSLCWLWIGFLVLCMLVWLKKFKPKFLSVPQIPSFKIVNSSCLFKLFYFQTRSQCFVSSRCKSSLLATCSITRFICFLAPFQLLCRMPSQVLSCVTVLSDAASSTPMLVLDLAIPQIAVEP